jgi:hypothetical protein
MNILLNIFDTNYQHKKASSNQKFEFLIGGSSNTSIQHQQEIIENDFIEMKTQMQTDFDNLIECLNNLWAKPIHDLNALLYVENNPHLLNLYDLDLSENVSAPGNTHFGQLYASGVSAISSPTRVSGSFTTSGANWISGIIDGSENPSHD